MGTENPLLNSAYNTMKEENHEWLKNIHFYFYFYTKQAWLTSDRAPDLGINNIIEHLKSSVTS